MKYLYSWLQEFYPNLPESTHLSDILNSLGHDVTSYSQITYPGLIVAEIVSVAKHSQADKLSVVVINDGMSEKQIVCGAPNLEVGQKVILAPIDTVLPCGITIKSANIRGELSNGMLLAGDELGLSNDHTSLYSLPDSAKAGELAKEYLPHDGIFDLDITPNRGDVLSHFGLARDIFAVCEHELLTANFDLPVQINDTARIKIGAVHPDVINYNLGRVTNLSNKAVTPLLIQSRLLYLGQKIINVPTDITNYVTLAYGQPLHSYDANKFDETSSFGVRRAHENESFVGLNETNYTLNPASLVVTNNDQPIALAGVLGGEVSKTTKTTTSTILESANYSPKAVTIMSRELQLSTESSQKFTRGVDPTLSIQVLSHTQALLASITSGESHEISSWSNKHEHVATNVELDEKTINNFFGQVIGREIIIKALVSIGCTVSDVDSKIIVSSPSWRFDLAIAEDYYEEIMRLVGINNLIRHQLSASVPQWKRSKYWRSEWLKDTLVNLGCYEISTYPFVSKAESKPLTTKESLELEIAPIADRQYMRNSLIPGTLRVIATNPDVPMIELFEIAKIYTPDQEVENIVIAVASNNQVEIDNWWRNLFERLKLPVASWMSRLITIDSNQAQTYKIRKSNVTILELPLDELIQTKNYEIPPVVVPDIDQIKYQSLSKYQSSRRDIAFIVDINHKPEQIIREIKQLNNNIVDVELFDTYTDPKLGHNKYSLAFHISYQSPDKTLTTEEIHAIHTQVESFIQESYHATIR